MSSLSAIKIALVLFYKRLAAPGTKLQITYNVAPGLLVIFWAVICFDIIFQCYFTTRDGRKIPPVGTRRLSDHDAMLMMTCRPVRPTQR